MKTIRWIICLCVMSALWFVAAFLSAKFTYNSVIVPDRTMGIISSVYIFVLLLVIMVGNIARVRMLMFMTSIYSIGVIVRSVYGVLISILIIDAPQNKLWFSVLDWITIPFTGLYYIASLLTSHFVTEIYWLGLCCISMMVLCFSLLGFMAVTGRNKKSRNISKNNLQDIINEKKERIRENKEFLEKISYSDKKD